MRSYIASANQQSLKQRILELFDSGYNCAESISVAFLEALGHDRELMRLATPFGAGIGGRRDLCGLLTGGTLIIGLEYGRTDASDVDGKLLAYKAAADYYRWFKTRHKVRCSEIVTGKFSGHTDDCVRLMGEAQAKLAEIVLSEEEREGS